MVLSDYDSYESFLASPRDEQFVETEEGIKYYLDQLQIIIEKDNIDFASALMYCYNLIDAPCSNTELKLRFVKLERDIYMYMHESIHGVYDCTSWESLKEDLIKFNDYRPFKKWKY